MAVWAGLSVAVLIVLVSFIGAVRGWARRALHEAEADAMAALGGEVPELIDAMANNFGVESAGATQLRGNGTLALISSDLVFVQAVPRRELRIPRGSITAVEEVPSHLGKRVGRPLLRVAYTRADGRADSAAWLVRDPSAWMRALAPRP